MERNGPTEEFDEPAPPSFNRTTAVNSDRTAYMGFFDPEWARSILHVVRRTKIYETVVDLIRNWQAASEARSWPWLITEAWHHDLREELERVTPLDVLKIRMLKEKFVRELELHGQRVNATLRKRIEKTLVAIDADSTAALALARQRTVVSHRDIWDDLIPLRSEILSIVVD